MAAWIQVQARAVGDRGIQGNENRRRTRAASECMVIDRCSDLDSGLLIKT